MRAGLFKAARYMKHSAVETLQAGLPSPAARPHPRLVKTGFQ
jgi:hypothetical protein